MNELITLTERQIGDDEIQTVNARDLHAFLEVGKDFSSWIKERVSQYGFGEGADFIVFTDLGGNPRGGRPAKEYAISLDMAKELAMVERNKKGKEARQYFIDCEKRSKEIDPMKALNDPTAMRGLLLTYSEKVIALESANAELAPKADALDRIATSDGSMCITDAAKTLQIRPKDLFGHLAEHHWIYTRQGKSGKIAHQPKLNQGLLEHKTTTVRKSDGYDESYTQVRVTPKGLARLAKEFPPVAEAA